MTPSSTQAIPPVRRRVVWLAVILGCWAALLAGRLADLQIVRRDALAERARRQQERTVQVEAARRRILDRTGLPLAESVEVPSLYADPGLLENSAAAAAALAPVLETSPQALRRVLDSDRSFAWLERRVAPATAGRVMGLGIRGVGMVTETRRFYPEGRLAANVLGFVGIDGHGLEGIELQEEGILSGRPGRMLAVRDARGNPLLMYLEHPSTAGQDLHLTLDAVIQYHAEVELERAMRETGSLWGVVVAMDPGSGAILAMATRPSFNPNDPGSAPAKARRNRVVTDLYEPGSTFKIITAAAVLERGLAQPQELLDCGRGAVVVAGHSIRDHKVFDQLTFTEVIAESSNVGAIRLGMRVPPREFHDTVRAFGFGSPTGVELPGERRGTVHRPENWSRISQASLSIGQEIGVTPLQLLRAAAVVASGGVLPQPYLIRQPRAAAPPPGRRVISASTAAVLNRMLERVVETGTGREAAIPGYRVAGKTGTAQKPNGTDGYGQGRVASFVGYVPSRTPALAMLVVLDSPQGRYHGGEVAAPVFARIARPALLRLGVGPEGSWISLAPDRGDAALRAARPAGPSPLVRTVDGAPVVPDVTGRSLREALSVLARAGLTARVEGSGRVAAQEPSPGVPLAEGGAVRLLLDDEAPDSSPAVPAAIRASR